MTHQVMVRVLSIDPEIFPGHTVFALTDFSGKVHTFEEKLPVVGIDLQTTPFTAWIDCALLKRNENSILISTDKPHGVQSVTEKFEFEVPEAAFRTKQD